MGAIWTTKEGRKIPVEEIGDRHLQNIFRMLLRAGFRAKSVAHVSTFMGPQPCGDGAIESLEHERRRISLASLGEFAPEPYKDIVAEIKRRDPSFDVEKAEEAYEEELCAFLMETFN